MTNIQFEINEAYRLHDKALMLKLKAVQLGIVQDVVYWNDEQTRQREIIQRLTRALPQPATSPITENEVQQ
jgi:hypothetical protein